MNVLHFDGICRQFRTGVPVLEEVSFAVAPGEVVGLLGRNGAGKTTLLHLAMGMLTPQAGTVRVFDLDPREHPVEVKRRVGFVAEDQILPGFLRVGEVLELHRGLFPTWDPELERDLLERFALPTRARVKTLSRGEARRLALLCAVAHRPELLLLDEPAGGLDPVARREFLETAIELLNQAGTTILFSSHHMADVERLAERVVMLHDGRALIDRPLDALHESHCLALVPCGPGVGRDALLGLDGCIAVRERSDAWHAVFEHEPERTELVIRDGLGIAGVRCRQAPLEDMFIEVMGGQG